MTVTDAPTNSMPSRTLNQMQMIQNPDGTTTYGTHKMCKLCIGRREKRALKRMSAQRAYACCIPDPDNGFARLHSRSKHNHSRAPGAMDHASFANFWPNDPGVTRAQRERERFMKLYLRNIDVPTRVTDREIMRMNFEAGFDVS